METRYDAVYDIHIAHVNEIPIIMQFIGTEWKKGHILSYNRDFFEYQYRNNDSVNMILAYRKETWQLEGLLGFIPANKDYTDAWGSMWKVRSGNMLFLGLELMQRLLDHFQFKAYMAPGINMTTTGKIVGKRFNWIVDRMKQWYILRPQKNYKLAVVKHAPKCTRTVDKEEEDGSGYIISDVGNYKDLNFNFEIYKHQHPYKDGNYVKNRYFDHPMFKYNVFAISSSHQTEAFFVTREISINGAKAVRLVDFIGNKTLIKHIGQWLQEHLTQCQAEYIDFYEYGFDDYDLRTAGFTERIINDENIIPNYFSPFEQRNVEIYFHAPDKGITMCKADGDQDRPN